MIGYIYKTTCIINGKIYVGKHESNIWDSTYYGSGSKLTIAITEFGKENFVWNSPLWNRIVFNVFLFI